MSGAQAALLPDGARLHLHHGPIDLIIGWEGPERAAAYRRATDRFATVLDELVPELSLLRAPGMAGRRFASPVPRRMQAAIDPHCAGFVTPMAAVAGAVADEILAALAPTQAVAKAYVNNGGDMALHLAAGATLRVAVASAAGGGIEIGAGDPVRGVATSGWAGRSFSFGIAEAVTVLARSAAVADVAATLIANAVDLPGHPQIARRPARDISPDSDLGARAVTVAVGALTVRDVEDALEAGAARARAMLAAGTIHAALLSLRGQVRSLGDPRLTGA